jgi:hypothetical protein
MKASQDDRIKKARMGRQVQPGGAFLESTALSGKHNGTGSICRGSPVPSAAALLCRKPKEQFFDLRAGNGMIRLNLPRGRAGVERVRLAHSFFVGQH